MSSIVKHIPAFNRGEVSPKLHARTDIDSWDRALRTCKNFIPMSHGGVRRRPGLEYLGTSKTAAEKCVLIPFNVSATTSYMLEFGNEYFRVYDKATGARLDYTTADVLDHAVDSRGDPSGTAWADATLYTLGDEVENGTVNGSVLHNWEAIHTPDHTSDQNVDEPGPGAGIQTRWALRWKERTTYEAGESVKVGSTIYRCLYTHYAQTDTVPGTGANWADVWELSSIIEIPTPYLEAELYDIQYAQINDVLYLVHPDNRPRKISRFSVGASGIAWKLEDIAWDDLHFPPMQDENTTDITIKVTEIDESTVINGTPADNSENTVVLVAENVPANITNVFQGMATGGNEFGRNKTGSFIMIRSVRNAQIYAVETTEDRNQKTDDSGVPGAFTFDGTWTLVTTPGGVPDPPGNWSGTINLYKIDPGTGNDVLLRSWGSGGNRTLNITGTTDGEETLWVEFVEEAGGNSAGALYFETQGADEFGYAEIIQAQTNYPNKTAAKILKPIAKGAATTYWTYGAFSVNFGFPRAVTFHEERLFFGGTSANRARFWGSESSDYENFKRGDEDSDGIDYTLAATENNTIEWMISQQGLVIGTSGGEWAVNRGGESLGITPSSVLARRYSHVGSKHVQAEVINDVILFVTRLGRDIEDLTYRWEADGFEGRNLSELSEHLTESGVIQMAYQQQRDSILWCVTADGQLIGVTYNRAQGVVGWHRHTTGADETDTFESVAVIYGDTEDEVWAVVKRTINGAVLRHIERFRPGYGQYSSPGWPQEDGWYVDAGAQAFASIALHASTAITNASPGIVTTAAAHGLVSGDRIRFRGVEGMTAINDITYKILIGGGTTFSFTTLETVAVNTTSFGTHVAGTGTVTKEITSAAGFTHLEAQSVAILADGALQPNATVASGAIAIDSASKITAGIPYTSEMKLMPLEVPLQDGSSEGRYKRIHRFDIRVLDSLGLKYAADEDDTFDAIIFDTVTQAANEGPALFTGWKRARFNGRHGPEADLIIRQGDPNPLTVLAVTPHWKTTEDT